MLINAPDGSVVIASIVELGNLRDIIKANEDLFVKKVKRIYYMDVRIISIVVIAMDQDGLLIWDQQMIVMAPHNM